MNNKYHQTELQWTLIVNILTSKFTFLNKVVRGRQIFVLFYLGVQSTMRDDTQKYVQFTCNIITCTMKSHYGMGLAFITWRKII
jgi:hypothetical protein